MVWGSVFPGKSQGRSDGVGLEMGRGSGQFCVATVWRLSWVLVCLLGIPAGWSGDIRVILRAGKGDFGVS